MSAPTSHPPNIRLIPRLDIKGTSLVKGIHLEGLRVLGRPADFARAYYLEGADELLFEFQHFVKFSLRRGLRDLVLQEDFLFRDLRFRGALDLGDLGFLPGVEFGGGRLLFQPLHGEFVGGFHFG